MYKHVIKPFLFLFDPEFVHNVFLTIGKLLGSCSFGRWKARLFYGYKGKDISKTIDGIKYKTPVGLAAGFDYNGDLTKILSSIAFGSQEVGSVTAHPYAGNPKPRLTRLPKSKSLIIYKGLKSKGIDRIIKKLKTVKRVKNFVIGISIAKTNRQKTGKKELAIEDYFESFKKLNESNIGDYYSINISCPNSFSGESFAKPDLLNSLLKKLRSIECKKPIYLKMPINLPWDEFQKLIEVGIKYNINGLIIGNLNKNYNDLDYRNEAPEKFRGGLSGKPCKDLSNNLIKRTKKAYGNKLTIIGCGGIFSPADAIEKFKLGADLVQLITGMIYEGPSLMKKICKEYAKL